MSGGLPAVRLAVLTAVVLAAATTRVPAADQALASVLSAKSARGTTVAEVRVLRGALMPGAVEVLTPAGRSDATIALPPGRTSAAAGETVSLTLVLRRALSLTDAVVVDRGAYPDYETAARVVSGPPVPAGAGRRAPRPARVAACPFTPGELKSTLGLEFRAGAASPEMPYPGGARLACRYAPLVEGGAEMTVALTLMDDPAQADSATFFSRMAGKMEPVPNDPDKALWQLDQAAATPALYYARQGIIAELRVAIGRSDPRYAAVRQALPKLHRVP